MHGNLVPVDYVTDRPAPRGLAKIATLIRDARAGNANTLLIDCGDTIQGTPLESVYQSIARTGADPRDTNRPCRSIGDPMMRAMNLLGYDAMTVGNHEYNAGLANLDQGARRRKLSLALRQYHGRRSRRRTRVRALHRQDRRRRQGGRHRHHHTRRSPSGSKPENLGAYRFTSPVDAVRGAVAKLRHDERPDIIVVAAHSGLGRNLADRRRRRDRRKTWCTTLPNRYRTWTPSSSATRTSNWKACSSGKVLLVQPKNGGRFARAHRFHPRRANPPAAGR